MLVLKDIADSIHETINFDLYVPLTITFEPLENKKEHHIYWRIGKFLEIGINPTSKVISSITLVAASDVCVLKKPISDCEENISVGIPLVETGKWQKNSYYLDDDLSKDFNVYLEKNNITILFDESNEIESKIRNGRVIFGFDRNNQLSFIKIENINEEEMEIFKKSLSH